MVSELSVFLLFFDTVLEKKSSTSIPTPKNWGHNVWIYLLDFYTAFYLGTQGSTNSSQQL